MLRWVSAEVGLRPAGGLGDSAEGGADDEKDEREIALGKWMAEWRGTNR